MRRTPVRTVYCPICAKRVTREGGPGAHFHRDHPDYKWHMERKGKTLSYYCDLCQGSFNGFGLAEDSLIRHYEKYHGLKAQPREVGHGESQAKRPNRTVYCPICAKRVTREGPGEHFRNEHPEYKWHREKHGERYHYYCDECNSPFHSFGDDQHSLKKHYEEYHPELIKPKVAESLQQRVTTRLLGEHDTDQLASRTSLPTVSELDRLLEQVNLNTILVKEVQKKNQELSAKCTSYAARIVELQNQLAQDRTRRY